MIDFNRIIDHFYDDNKELKEILVVHSRNVAEMAMEVIDSHDELPVDRDFVYAAAMLHDIGIVRCDADGIKCYGTEPYICHGTIGASMIREYGCGFGMTTDEVEAVARVCERHTGTGLTAEDIVSQSLPLESRDLVPETLGEIIVCYADKFFSKTHPEVRKPYERVLKSLSKFGTRSVSKMEEWHRRFS